MGKVVSLPFSTPMFASFHSTAAVGIACIGHPDGETQVLNKCTNLICHRMFLQGYSSPKVEFLEASFDRFPDIIHYIIHLFHAKEYCNRLIHDMIDGGLYVYFSEFDDYFLPGKSWYHTRHFNHDGIICGYDDNDETYEVAAYDTDWIFRLQKIPQQAFEESMQVAFELNYFPKITALRYTGSNVSLDLEGICNGLMCYLDSNLDKFPPTEQGPLHGIAVNDYLAMYMDKLADGSIPYERMDWRPMRVLWEFRVCMLKRIQAVEKRLGRDSKISEQYSSVVEETNRLRMLYAVYTKRKKNSLLESIKCGLIELKDKERFLLQQLIDQITEALRS